MIRGFFDPSARRPRPMLTFAVYLPGLTDRWDTVDFLIDTGSETTVLHPVDALYRLNLDPRRLAQPEAWPRRGQSRGVGGRAVRYLWPTVYLFSHDDGARQPVTTDIRIAQPTPANEDVPSLLGWDLLQSFEISMNWPARSVTLSALGV